MKILSKVFRLGSSLLLASAAVFLVCPQIAQAQSSEPPPSNPTYSDVAINQVDYCNLWEADYSNSVEETVCFVSDWTSPDTTVDVSAEVDQDLTWYEGYPDWPDPSVGPDPNVAGLGAEAVVTDLGPNYEGEVLDTGMVLGSLEGANPPSISTWNNTSTYYFSPATWGDLYQIEGYYSECIDPTGTGSSTCNWNGTNDSGIAVSVQIEAPA